MKVLVFGTRTFSDREFLFNSLDEINTEYRIHTIIEGEAKGADLLAREWAIGRGITLEPYPANWARFRYAAGPIRNRQMLEEGMPDMAVGFLDKPLDETKGSRNMFDQAEAAGVIVQIREVESPA